jgi:hypothetical protein
VPSVGATLISFDRKETFFVTIGLAIEAKQPIKEPCWKMIKCESQSADVSHRATQTK